MKKVAIGMAGCASLLIMLGTSARPAGAAIIEGNLVPRSSTTIPEGSSVLFGSTFTTTVAGTHIGSGSSGYSPGGPADLISGPGSFGLPHDWTSFTGPNAAFRYRDDGFFTAVLTGGASTHDSSQFHTTVATTSFSTQSSARRTITVFNVAPQITGLTGDLTVLPGELFNFSATAFDPGVLDTLLFQWDLDDNGSFGDFVGNSGSFAFASSGLYPIAVSVSDGDGGFDFGAFNVTVVDQQVGGVAAVPEPATASLLLLGIGMALVAARRRLPAPRRCQRLS